MADEYTGFVIVRLSPARFRDLIAQVDDLRELARRAGATALSRVLDAYPTVSTERLITSVTPTNALELEARATSNGLPPRRSLTQYWRLDARQINDPENLVSALEQLGEVDRAYRQLTGGDTAVVNSGDDQWAKQQTHLDAAPVGIDARWAWTHPFGAGDDVAFVDMEQGWLFTHRDVPQIKPLPGVPQDVLATSEKHGTAVLGIAVGVDNSEGIIGVAPATRFVSVASHYRKSDGTNGHVADAIESALVHLQAGDVLAVEYYYGANYPAEYEDATWDVIYKAYGLGIIIVESAGNGRIDLDTIPQLNRTNAATFLDSGAIVVGGSESKLDATGKAHDRWVHPALPAGSNFGSRVDCYAFAEHVVTAGPDLAGSPVLDAGTGPNDCYRQDFGGTSAATAIIAGAALVLQGMYKGVTGVPVGPEEIRKTLSTIGTPQGTGKPGAIGVMPDLKRAAASLSLIPDVYIRDSVVDIGATPTSGTLYMSPDIIVLPQQAPQPSVQYGEGSGTEYSDTLGSQAVTGQSNFVYVRMRNRGGLDATGTTATIYWSPPTTLVSPALWTAIGTTGAVDVPEGDLLTVAPGIQWTAAKVPASGHYCLVALLDHHLDPKPIVAPGAPIAWQQYLDLISNNNNIAWRNITVVDLQQNAQTLPFTVMGADDSARQFDFEFFLQFPHAIEIDVEIPRRLANVLAGIAGYRGVRAASSSPGNVQFRLPNVSSWWLRNVPLRGGDVFDCSFILRKRLQYVARTRPREYAMGIRQMFGQREVGRLTWRVRL